MSGSLKKISDLTAYTPATDTDVLPIVDTINTTTKKITWANVKVTLKAYNDTLYAAVLGSDENYVSDAELIVLQATSGSNTGDQVKATGAEIDTGTNDDKFVTAKALEDQTTFAKLVSPTFTTPALGTPSSGTLTNCTFPTLNQNTTGTAAGLSVTLIVGSGGTGLSTVAANSYIKGNDASALVPRTYAEVKTDLSLENVDNTSDATKNAATVTLTNKRITARIGTVADAATVTPVGDSNDQYTVTALAQAATIAAPSGTPTNGQKLILRIKDNGTTRSLTWNAIYNVVGVTLPTDTTAGKTHYIGLIYNTANSKWDAVAIVEEA